MNAPTLFAITPDHRLKPGECSTTYHERGTQVVVQSIVASRGSINMTVKDQLHGLKGNQLLLSYEDCAKLGLDIDLQHTGGRPTDVAIVIGKEEADG